jgi:type IV pilus assembly protein PilE
MRIRSLTSCGCAAGRADGFTLIELMIAMAILAIISAIAYPNYRSYVLRGQIVSATDGLSAVSANMERYFQDYRQYNSVTAGQPPASPCDTQYYPTITYGTFGITCAVPVTGTPPVATTFKLTAAGSGATAGFTYTIDQTGTQTTSVVSPAPSAWRITCSSTWETKAGTC